MVEMNEMAEMTKKARITEMAKPAIFVRLAKIARTT